VSDEDVVQIKAKSREMDLVLQGAESPEREVPDYIDVDYKDMKARFLRGPKLEDVPYPVQMEPNLVVEFYSK
jgi:small subunit ribosomal protein S4